jgi:hypothetical protein
MIGKSRTPLVLRVVGGAMQIGNRRRRLCGSSCGVDNR